MSTDKRSITLPDREPRRVTLEAVAAEAGVSKAAASSLLSGKTYGAGRRRGVGVSAETGKSILLAARKLRYRPEKADALLRVYPEEGHCCFLMNRKDRAGFDSFYVDILRGVVDALAGAPLNVNLALFDTDSDYLDRPEDLPYAVTEGMTNKFILVGEPNLTLLEAVRKRTNRLIYLSRLIETEGVAAASPDHEQAGYLGVRHLLELGHRRIAVAAEPYFRGMSYHLSRLTRGVERAMQEAGVAFAAEDVVFNRQPDVSLASTVVDELWARSVKPTAIFGFCDLTATRVLAAAAGAGLRVPAELSVVGVNDQPSARESHPPLTSIRFPLRELGAVAVEHFRRLDDGLPAPSQYLLPVSLIERASACEPRMK